MKTGGQPDRAPRHAEGSIQSPYLSIERSDWAPLASWEMPPLTPVEVTRMQGVNQALSVDEVEQVYLPLARLIRLRIDAHRNLARREASFLGHTETPVPFIVGLAGSVAVGKSTTARVLQTLLRRGPRPLKVERVTTDGFLFPNAELERRGLLRRKGFPESYDQRGLLDFVHSLKSGAPVVEAPVYSHQVYDIVAGDKKVLRDPDVVILEGLNVLQTGTGAVFVSDYFDFSLYVDAELSHLRAWYLARFMRLRDTAFRDPSNYFHRYAALSEDEAREVAMGFWTEINERNLKDNILGTRERADLILDKGADHSIQRVHLRKA